MLIYILNSLCIDNKDILDPLNKNRSFKDHSDKPATLRENTTFDKEYHENVKFNLELICVFSNHNIEPINEKEIQECIDKLHKPCPVIVIT